MIEEFIRSEFDLWVCLLGTVMSVNRCRKPPPTVGGTIPRQLALGFIGKLGKFKPASKSESEPAAAFMWLWFLSQDPALASLSEGL